MEGRYLIGIDCGVNTGVAVYDPESKTLVSLETTTIDRAAAAVLRLRDAGSLKGVYFEDARQRKWFEQERSRADYRGKLMGAGAVKRDAKIWEDFLTNQKIPFSMVAPRHNATKMNADYFARVTGYKGRCSEHARDAAMLVFGR